MSNFKESKIHLLELKLQAVRLKAQVNKKPFIVDENTKKQRKDLVDVQKGLYKSNIQSLKNQQAIINAQIDQKKSLLNETRVKIGHLRKKLTLVKKQISITKPLVERKVESEANFLELQRDKIEITQQLSVSSSSIKGLESAISELRKNVMN